MVPADTPKQALLEVFMTRRSELKVVAAKIVGRYGLVDDVVQDAYLKLAEGVWAGEIRDPFAYCCQVVRHLAFDYCRRRVVESTHIVSSPNGQLPEVRSDAAIESRIDHRRLIAQIANVLERLPPRTRRAFELYRLEGRSQREIASQLGVSATLVNFMLKDATRALSACKDALDN